MKTKKFRVVKAGQTTDGRAVPSEHIEQMAANYNPATFGARVNIEHIKSIFPNSDFKAYGDVVGLEVETDGEDTYLVAEVDPTEDLVALSQARQKVYFSVEYHPNFADTGSAYLMGLACTDSPASLGTSYMTFCQQHPDDNPLSARKSQPDNVISTAEFSASFEPTPAPKPSLFSAISKLFTEDAKTEDPIEKKAEDLAHTLKALPDKFGAIEKSLLEIAKAQDSSDKRLNEVLSKQNEQQTELTQLQGTLDNTPDQNYQQRPLATGGASDYQKTDC